MAPPLRVRITAAVDTSFANVLNTMATAAKRAGKKIGDDLGAGAALGAGPYRSMPARVRAPMDEAASAAKNALRVIGTATGDVDWKFQKLVTGMKAVPPELKTIAAEAQKELAKIERAQARAALGIGGGRGGGAGGGSFWSPDRLRSFGGGLGQMSLGVAARIGGGALSFATQLGSDFLRGIGVHTDLSGMFAESQKNETLFRNISSFGYMPGTGGPNAERIDPATLLHEAHKVGQQTGFSAGEVGEGLEKFVGLTGDLNLGRQSLRDMAVLSKATGSNLMEMVEAAGAASNTLGNVPDKARVLYDVMKQVSSEGKTGAILIKDLAVQMAKIASSAQMFGGDRAHTIGILGAIAQEARGRGGAASASQAATSVQSFTNVFRKRQRLDTFTGFGIKAYEATGGIRDPQELILESFAAAMRGGHRLTPGGKRLPMPGAIGAADPSVGWQRFETNLTALYGDVKAMRATAGFETIYKDAYAGTKGTEQQKLAAAAEAVREEFHRLTVDMMDEATVQKDFQLAMQTSKSQVAVLNDRLQETAEQFQKEMLPAVLSLAPEMVLLAKGAASAVEALLGVKKPDTGKPGDIKPGSSETPEETERANRTTAAASAALSLADRRNVHGRKPGDISGLPLYAVSAEPGAVSIPQETAGILYEHAAALASATALAHGRLNRAKRNLVGGTLDAAGNYTGRSEEEIARIDAGRVKSLPGYADNSLHKEYIAAEKELMSAEQEQRLARAITDAIREGLATGRFDVTVVDDKTKRPPGGSQPTMPAESQ